jgi:hydroxypyruvate reductase
VDARRVTEIALFGLRREITPPITVRVVAAGKAAWGMAEAVAAVFGDRVTAGLVTSRRPPHDVESALGRRWRAVAAGHPMPTSASEVAGRMALSLASDALRGDETLIVCLSGGASAMLAVPAAGLTIEDKARATSALLRGGASIDELNLVRRHLSGVKGGQLAAHAGRSITFAISDVCVPRDDDPSVIGSGPMTGAVFDPAGALAVLRRCVGNAVPLENVVRYLERAAIQRPPDGPIAPADPRLAGAAYWVVASRADAMRAAAETARRFGYAVDVRREALIGEARQAGPALVAAAGRARPACVIASGETTVAVRGRGKGGRNQELISAALEPLAVAGPAALASIGTDGIDGPTDAAGGFADHTMWANLGAAARAICDDALARNDTYPMLDGLGALVRTGPTGTNVGDLQVLLLPAARE